jgi:hypothetical protein
MPFSISGLLSSLNLYQSLIRSLVCVCVCVCEVNFVLFNSMLKYVINRLMHAFFPYQNCYHPSTDIDPRAKALWPISVSRDDNSLDTEKGTH